MVSGNPERAEVHVCGESYVSQLENVAEEIQVYQRAKLNSGCSYYKNLVVKVPKLLRGDKKKSSLRKNGLRMIPFAYIYLSTYLIPV